MILRTLRKKGYSQAELDKLFSALVLLSLCKEYLHMDDFHQNLPPYNVFWIVTS